MPQLLAYEMLMNILTESCFFTAAAGIQEWMSSCRVKKCPFVVQAGKRIPQITGLRLSKNEKENQEEFKGFFTATGNHSGGLGIHG
jgi:hypothetical protein